MQLKPDYAEALSNLGIVLTGQGKLDEAATCFRRVLQLKPDSAEAHNNLGIVLGNQGRLDEAVACYRRMLQLRPDSAEAHNNLGVVLMNQGKLDEAATCYRRALQLKPGYAEAHNNLGNALKDRGKHDEAVACYRRALQLKPGYAEAHNNLGNALKDAGDLDEALTCFRRALQWKPDYAEVHNNLGNACMDRGQLDEALAAYRAGLALKPDYPRLGSNLIYLLMFHPAYDAPAILQECRRWDRQHAEPLAPSIRPHGNSPDLHRRLRVGYVSPHFRDHCQAFFTVPLLSNHDHRKVEVFCYAGVARADAVTERLRGYADVWCNTVALSDQQLADRIRGDRIDILVDLSMHMADNRLPVFARKPAPVQVAWLAYPGTTGLAAMDYRLTDPYLDPPGLSDGVYSEDSVRLPETFWCYDPLTCRPPVNALPALRNGYVTFGCLNNFCKVNDGVLALWAKVLQAVPGSRLLLLAPRGRARDHVRTLLGQHGVAEPPIEFTDRLPRREYLGLYHRIDLGLDPLPANGHTTSLDAFWMGVPTITLAGETVSGRAGWSQLSNLGLQELAAETPGQLAALAARVAGDLPRLAELRGSLRRRMRQSPLMDGRRFARHMEQAYRRMWQRWCHDRRRHEPA